MDILVESLFPGQPTRNQVVPGFFVKSTARPNVEEDDQEIVDRDRPTIQDVVQCLTKNSKANPKKSGLVIAIHGYNTGFSDDPEKDGILTGWYQLLSNYINQDPYLKKKQNSSVFIGYRWSSEQIEVSNFMTSLKALPILLSVLLYGGIAATLLGLAQLFIFASDWLVIPIILGTFFPSLVVSLFLLRFVVYFRDAYRATNYGVPDLVELVRQLDQGLIESKTQDWFTEDVLYEKVTQSIAETRAIDKQILLDAILKIRQEVIKQREILADGDNSKFQALVKKLTKELHLEIDEKTLTRLIKRILGLEIRAYNDALRYWRLNPIKLSFIGHSMGGHVTTQVIRILSDVFDPNSVGQVGSSSAKQPSPSIGRVFCLGRLVLASPDIPLLTITSGRANFLRSSLRRFEEAYLFSNEGDLALRLASTAANYFSFPAKSRTQGYRLGNVTIKRLVESSATVKKSRASRNKSPVYGVVNFDKLPNLPFDHLLPYLEVNVLNKGGKQSLDPATQQAAQQKDAEAVASLKEDKESIADLFTYFDCTEYQDFTDYNPKAQQMIHKVMILDGQKTPLNILEYFQLFIGYATFSPKQFPKGKDVHGGYFWGRFSQLLVYRLAFLGFQGLLDSLLVTSPKDLGIEEKLPDDLLADLAKARETDSAFVAMTEMMLDATKEQQREQLARLRQKREVALRYFSWLCQQRLIQVALSPERYHVDIMGRDRTQIREGIVQQEE